MLAGIVIQAIAAKLMMIQAKPEVSRKFSLCSAMIVTLFYEQMSASRFYEVISMLLLPYSGLNPSGFLLAGIFRTG